jgi:hypothetical protein
MEFGKHQAARLLIEGSVSRGDLSIEISGRHKAVHAATMYEGSLEDSDAEVQLTRIARVRSMLIALVARVAGYRGPIVGWERDKRRRWTQAPTDWWAVGEAQRPLSLELLLAGEDREGFVTPRNALTKP